jgi:hypothetical protein
MSEDNSESLADQLRKMVHCLGCGFNVEQEDARKNLDLRDGYGDAPKCNTCIKCETCPDMRESYRRGYNAGINRMCDIMNATITRRPTRSE